MKLETYTLQIIVTILCSVGAGAVITTLANRKKTKAETQLITAEYFTTMLNDLRAQINMQGDQIKNQAGQILTLQKKETGYLKMINNYQKREKDFTTRIKELETKILELQTQLT